MSCWQTCARLGIFCTCFYVSTGLRLILKAGGGFRASIIMNVSVSPCAQTDEGLGSRPSKRISGELEWVNFSKECFQSCSRCSEEISAAVFHVATWWHWRAVFMLLSDGFIPPAIRAVLGSKKPNWTQLARLCWLPNYCICELSCAVSVNRH